VYRLFITPTAIGSSRPTSTHPHNSTRATMVMALTSQGFARAPTATRSALAPRGTWTLDAMTMAFVRSESVEESGRRETTTTTTLDRPTLDRGGTRERYATEIRDRGEPGMKTRSSRAR